MNVKQEHAGTEAGLFLEAAVAGECESRPWTNKVISGEDSANKSPKETGLCPRALSPWEK